MISWQKLSNISMELNVASFVVTSIGLGTCSVFLSLIFILGQCVQYQYCLECSIAPFPIWKRQEKTQIPWVESKFDSIQFASNQLYPGKFIASLIQACSNFSFQCVSVSLVKRCFWYVLTIFAYSSFFLKGQVVPKLPWRGQRCEIFVFFSSLSLKTRKKCISFAQLVLLSLYIF